MTTPISITVGGISLTINQTAAPAKVLSGVAIKKEDRHADGVSVYDLNKLKYRCVAEEQLEDGLLLDVTAVTDQASLEEVYDATQIIKQVRSHFKKYDMLTPFTIVVPVKDPTTGDILGQDPTAQFNLFEQHAKVTYTQIVDSIKFYMKWIFREATAATSDSQADPGTPWVETDITWSGEFLYNQMSPKLANAIKDDLKDKNVPDDYHETGPIVLKALIDRMLNSNYNALKLLKAGLNRDKVSLDIFDGDIEEFAKMYTSDLSETLLLSLLNTGHQQFDLIMNQKYAACKGAAAMGNTNPYPPPEQVLSEARRLFVSFRQTGDWDTLPGDSRNPSGFRGS